VDTYDPYQVVKAHYKLPFELYNYQEKTVNELGYLQRSGHYLAVGVGKTATSTCVALYKMIRGQATHVIVLMPPILITTWLRWLESIQNVTAVAYRGTPKERALISLDAEFTLMSYDIFKRDQARILKNIKDCAKVILICDEATAIKNIESQTHQAVRDIVIQGAHLMLLTGTPMSKVYDAYAYIRFLGPSVYRNFKAFQNIHTLSYDFFKNPCEYQNLQLLADNMKLNSVRILKEDVLKELPAITYTPIFYNLAPAHQKLYKRLADEQLLELEDGGKIDATQVTALYHALQQCVVSWDYFGADSNLRAACYDVIDEVIEELAGRKLIIFTYYQRSSRAISRYLEGRGAVAVYGATTPKQKQINIDRFISDPNCREMVAQVQSAGYGLNLQESCSDILFIETPTVPMHFEQATGRVYRNGQKHKVQVRVAVAEETIQVRLQQLLIEKDSLINSVVRNFKDLKNALYGL